MILAQVRSVTLFALEIYFWNLMYHGKVLLLNASYERSSHRSREASQRDSLSRTCTIQQALFDVPGLWTCNNLYLVYLLVSGILELNSTPASPWKSAPDIAVCSIVQIELDLSERTRRSRASIQWQDGQSGLQVELQ